LRDLAGQSRVKTSTDTVATAPADTVSTVRDAHAVMPAIASAATAIVVRVCLIGASVLT
jgi:hypothetical protein